MRPSGVTAAASVNTKAAPPTAREARCAKCQSFAWPSTDEYWHIGETTMRLAKSTSRMRSLLNRCGMDQWSRSRMEGERQLLGSARAVVMTDALMNHILRRSVVKPNSRGDPIVQGGWGPPSMLRALYAKGFSAYW